MCKTCGAVHEGNDALKILLMSAFTPVEVKEEPKPEPRPAPKPVQKSAKVEPDFDEEVEDLRVD